MTEEEYTEPSNEQLARFLMVRAGEIPGTENLQLSAPILELLINNNPKYRETALRHHRRFQEEITILAKKVEDGSLGCAHIRKNGKRCPNANRPGNYYCGLHLDEETDSREIHIL